MASVGHVHVVGGREPCSNSVIKVEMRQPGTLETSGKCGKESKERAWGSRRMGHKR